MMYLMTMPENRLERKGRVAGWVSLHMAEKDKVQLRSLCSQLKDKGIACAYSSDLDEDALDTVASELGVPKIPSFHYRRFNVGRNHKAKAGHVTMLVDHLVGQWQANEAIPIRGGDSWMSLHKRLESIWKLIDRPEPLVFVTDAQTATLIVYRNPKALLMNGTGLKPGKVYVVGEPKREMPKFDNLGRTEQQRADTR